MVQFPILPDCAVIFPLASRSPCSVTLRFFELITKCPVVISILFPVIFSSELRFSVTSPFVTFLLTSRVIASAVWVIFVDSSPSAFVARETSDVMASAVTLNWASVYSLRSVTRTETSSTSFFNIAAFPSNWIIFDAVPKFCSRFIPPDDSKTSLIPCIPENVRLKQYVSITSSVV